MANNFSGDWRKNNPTMYQSRKTGICHLPGSRTTLILTVGVIVFYLSVSTFMIASLRRSAGSLERMNPACDNHKKRDYGKQSQSDCNDCFIRTFEDRASFLFFAERKDDDSRGIKGAGDKGQLKSRRIQHPDAVKRSHERKEASRAEGAASAAAV